MEKECLVGRVGHGHYPVSRDWKHIDCQAVGCRYNLLKTCNVPSWCEINETGGCKGFEPKPLPAKIDGD